jgi:ribosome biogenesis protein UTP30
MTNRNLMCEDSPLKYPLRTEDQQVCLITKDPQREYKDQLRSKNLMESTVHKVIGVTKLRQKYKPHEAKRLLCRSYDSFLADERVIPLLPKLLGKTFFERKKIPVPVNLTRKDVGKELERALDSTYLFVGNGCTSENIADALPALMEKIPKGWSNIQSIHLKTNQSVALPLYNSLPTVGANQEQTAADGNNNEVKESKEDRKRRLAAEGKLPDLAFRDVCKRIKLKV